MGHRGLSATERCIYLVALLITGDVEPRPPTSMETAREIVAMVDADDLTPLSRRLSDDSHLSMDRLHTRAASMRETYGPARQIEEIDYEHGHFFFRVVAERGVWQLSLDLSSEGEIEDLTLEPELLRSVPLGLPFRGRWYASNAGPTRAQNKHRPTDQRRAVDLFAVDESGRASEGDRSKNENYFTYGKDALAMADGEVVVAVDGVHENVPGVAQPNFIPGNVVIIEHPGGMFGMYAHLIPGSVAVRAGESVVRGQLLGKCGNSGNSGAPHLHVHGQDRPFETGAWGIEMVFESVWRTRYGEREHVSNYVFRRGDTVSPG